MSNSISFVVCVEPGLLEIKALCLFVSLRKNAGEWADVPVYAYSPRPRKTPSPWMLDIYSELGITPVIEPLNCHFYEYPLANKPISMSHAEKTISSDILVFLDSDIVMWDSPKMFSLPEDKNIGMVVDGTKTIASAGPNDRYEEMWQQLYHLTGATEPPWVTTYLTKQHVRSWWCTGVISVRRSARLMHQWNEVFCSAVESVSYPREAMYLREQSALCAVAAACPDRVQSLPLTYNFPVQNFTVYEAQGWQASEAVLWHYQPFLNRAMRKFGSRLSKAQETKHRINEATLFLERLRQGYPKMLGLDESFFHCLRKKLKLGIRVRKCLGIEKESDRMLNI